jgi:chaperonin GroES
VYRRAKSPRGGGNRSPAHPPRNKDTNSAAEFKFFRLSYRFGRAEPAGGELGETAPAPLNTTRRRATIYGSSDAASQRCRFACLTAGFFPGSPPQMKIVPINDKVVVRRLPAEVKTAGGIVLPESAQEKPQFGRVLSVGDGRLLRRAGRRAEPQVSEGDRVLVSTYAGTEVTLNGETLLIVPEGEILAVLD